MLFLKDIYPHLQPADALLGVLFERTASRYRAALAGVRSGAFPAPPKPQLTPEQHMRVLLPSLVAPLTSASRAEGGGGGSSTGGMLAGVGSSLPTRHPGTGQPAPGSAGGMSTIHEEATCIAVYARLSGRCASACTPVIRRTRLSVGSPCTGVARTCTPCDAVVVETSCHCGTGMTARLLEALLRASSVLVFPRNTAGVRYA